jgi:exonuclease SbcC
LAEATAAEERRPRLNDSIASAKEEMGRRKGDVERLLQEMQRLKKLQTEMTQQGAVCTICRRPVSEHERQYIHDDYQSEGLQRKAEYSEGKQRITTLEGEIGRYTEELSAIERLTKSARATAREEGDLRRQVTTARDAKVRLLDVMREREVLATQLANADFAHEARARVGELAAAIAALAVDSEAYPRLQARVAELTPYDEQARALERAEQALGPERERLFRDRETLKLREGAREEETARIAELLAERADLPALIRRTEELAVQLDQARRQYEELARRQGSLEATLSRLADLEEEAERSRESRRTLAEEEGIYRELARAFGKGGIQAMIIEGAVPELQDEANAILANMPGNSMRVEFRTQRETRKGDTVEALEIVIGDEAGQRDYAMYSGGEAFRINFAIRVALAKLLARRAGAKLQMLVIDEGFGTQDARGRDSLVEAIHAIEDDFQMVLVITHVNELKDLFPTQILVEKGPGGSQVTVS